MSKTRLKRHQLMMAAQGNRIAGNPVLQAKLNELRNNSDAPKNFGQPIVRAQKDSKEVDVYLYDVIGWPWLTALDFVETVPKDAKHINLYINSPGGEVYEGLAIFDFFERHEAFVDVRVTGLAGSMASIIYLAGDRRTVPKNRYLMIHKPWAWMVGTDDDLQKEADLLKMLGDDMAALYAEESGNDLATVKQWMNDTTYFNGADAVKYGFADPEEENESGQKAEKSKQRAVSSKQEENETCSPLTAHCLPSFNLEVFTPDIQTPKRVAMALPNNTNHINRQQENDNMNDKLRKVLEAKGLATDATDEQAWEFLANLNSQQSEPVDPEALQAEAIKAEQARQKEIRKMCKIAKMDGTFTENLIDTGITPENASQKIFDEMAKTNPPFGPGTIQVGTTDGEKFHAAARDGLLMRAGEKVEKPALGAQEFRGYEMTAIIRECLRRSGEDVSRLNSRKAIADYVFGRRYGSMSTDDFPKIFRDAANKSLLRAYTEYPATWRPWVRVRTASDFKTIYGANLSEAPDLAKVAEHEEYSFGAFKESEESYRMFKYGKVLYLSWEMLINDDLSAFNRAPVLMGNAARRLEADVVYALLLSNSGEGPRMATTATNMFNASHNNLEAGTSGEKLPVNAANLNLARVAMRKQTGMTGAKLDIRPRFLLVPVAQETAVEVLLRSRGSTDDDKNSLVINPWYNRLEPIAEPRLDDASVVAWYLIGDPNQIDTFEVAFLDGNEQPELTEHEEFTRDAMGWKIRHVFGVGAMDYRGFFRNPGA